MTGIEELAASMRPTRNFEDRFVRPEVDVVVATLGICMEVALEFSGRLPSESSPAPALAIRGLRSGTVWLLDYQASREREGRQCNRDAVIIDAISATTR